MCTYGFFSLIVQEMCLGLTHYMKLGKLSASKTNYSKPDSYRADHTQAVWYVRKYKNMADGSFEGSHGKHICEVVSLCV